MDDPIAVTLDAAGSAPRFSLCGTNGSAPEVVGAVMEDSAGKRLWWIVLETFTELTPAMTDEQAIKELEAMGDEQGPMERLDESPVDDWRDRDGVGSFDPIEDPPASDWRHQHALKALAPTELAVPVLSALAYGVVPHGYRQLLPDDGVAPPLRPGARYVLHVLGADGAGHLAFRVE